MNANDLYYHNLDKMKILSQHKEITALTEENRRLKESQENTVKMLREVLRMLDTKLHL